jgi:hypothetical protein
MSKRYDVMAPRPGREEGKTFWHRVGTAFESEKGIGIIFDSLPLPDKDGRVSVRLFEPREKPETKKAAPERERPARPTPIDDEIPF